MSRSVKGTRTIDPLLRSVLADVAEGRLDVDEACRRLGAWPHERLPIATIDHHRELRNGMPEVVFCERKTPAEAATIAERIWRRSGRLFATRADPEHAAAIRARIPLARHHRRARTVSAGAPAAADGPDVLVITAGTSDLPVAHEAVETVRMAGEPVALLNDVGVAGIHRLLAEEKRVRAAGTIIVAAGMEGALASVVGGLVSVPVIALPTSVGYGASFDGLAALLAMLNSCAAGVLVVNIDNGFGAGCAAARINALRRETLPRTGKGDAADACA